MANDCLMQAPLFDKQEEWQFVWLSEGSLENEPGVI